MDLLWLLQIKSLVSEVVLCQCLNESEIHFFYVPTGWYSEINEILQNLSDPIFMECVIYLQHMSIEYFDCIQKKIDRINQSNLKRLRNQLDPFSAVFRPVVSQLSSNFIESDTNDINKVRNIHYKNSCPERELFCIKFSYFSSRN